MFRKHRDKPKPEPTRRAHIDDLPKPTTPDPGISERQGAIDHTPREQAAS